MNSTYGPIIVYSKKYWKSMFKTCAVLTVLAFIVALIGARTIPIRFQNTQSITINRFLNGDLLDPQLNIRDLPPASYTVSLEQFAGGRPITIVSPRNPAESYPVGQAPWELPTTTAPASLPTHQDLWLLLPGIAFLLAMHALIRSFWAE